LELGDLLLGVVLLEALLEERLHRLAAEVGPPDEPLVSLKGGRDVKRCGSCVEGS
jgi:hypothetical protein